jgi:hypothetical protein
MSKTPFPLTLEGLERCLNELAGLRASPLELTRLLERLQPLRAEMHALEDLIEPWLEPPFTFIFEDEDERWPTKS